MYKIINEQQILRTEDNAIIPVCAENSDYQEYLKWLNEGNKAEELPPIEPPPQTIFSKLEIRRAFRALKKETVLDELLSSNSEFAKDWSDANEIDLNDTVTAQALKIIDQANNGITIEAIINQITGV